MQKAEKAPPARAEKAPAKHDPPPEKPAQTGGTIVVDMRNFEHDGGKVRVALWRTENGFPRKAGNAASRRSTRVRNGRARLVFRDVPPGDFAVMVHHDEDADGELDTNMVGMPTEGFGVSRDAPANFGPPSYDDARLALSRGENKRVVITMRY